MRHPIPFVIAILMILGAVAGCHHTQKRQPTLNSIQSAEEALQKCASAENLAELAAVLTNESSAAVGCHIAPLIAMIASLTPSSTAKDSWKKLQENYDLPGSEANVYGALFSVMASSISGKNEANLSPEEKSKLEKELAAQCDTWKAQCKKLTYNGRKFLKDLHSFDVLFQKEGGEASFTVEEQFKNIDIAKLNFTVLSPDRIKITGPGLQPPTWISRIEEDEWRIHFTDCDSIACFGR